MTRYRTDLDTASATPITELRTTCNPVTRICALSEGQSVKAASETLLSLPSCLRLPVKAKSPKSLILSNGLKVTGVKTRPLMRLVGCQFRYTNLYVTAFNGELDHAANRWGRSLDLYSKGRFGKRSLRVPTVTTGLPL